MIRHTRLDGVTGVQTCALPISIAIPASDIALELGNPKCMNVVLFGAMCDSLGCPDIDWEQIVAETVPAKVKDLNLQAFRAGREAASRTAE